MPLVAERRLTAGGRRRGAALACACGVVWLSSIAAAARAEVGVTGFGAWRLVPTASLTQTFTTNVQGSAAGGSADSITDAGVGVTLSSGAGLVTGLVDYRLSTLLYARDGSRNTLRNNLRAHVDAEWYERRGFLAMDASISQQAISAFGFQPAGGSSLASSNTTETATVRLAPRWLGLLPLGLRADLSGEYNATAVSNSNTGDNHRLTGGLHVSPQTTGRLGWSADVQKQRSSFRAGRTTDTTTVFGSLSYRVDEIDTLFSASAGRQRTDLMSFDQASYAYWSVGAAWVPSPRTALRARLDHQAFGQSHELSFEHRTALTSLRISDSRSLNSGGNQSGITVLGTAFQLFDSLYASIEPDKTKREALVNALLKSRGITDPNTPVAGGFLASSATIADNRSLSLGTQWQRSSATLIFTRGNSQRAGRMLTALDDLSTSNQIRLSGMTLLLTHALTPLTSINLSFTDQSTRGDTAQQAHDQRGVNLLYTDRSSSTLTWSLGLRHNLYETGATSSNESAVIAAVAAKF